MFQTEPIIWLQSFRSDALTWVMRGISVLGQETLFLVLALIVFFGFNHRNGFRVLLTILWVGLLTAAVKSFFALPRPSDADMRVLLLEFGVPNTSPFFSRGATWFLGLPSPDVISYVRAMPGPDYGLLSGHCSSTLAFWGALAYLFRKRWLAWIAIGVAFLMPISRMYLGRHFAGDTLAGLLLGGIAILFVTLVFPRTRDNRGSIFPALADNTTASQIIEIICLIVLPGALFLTSETANVFSAPLLALGLVYYLTLKLRAFDSTRGRLERIISTLLALSVAVVMQILLKGAMPKSIAYGLVTLLAFTVPAVSINLFKTISYFRRER